ncbi:MAG: hypothetical protein JWQ09_4578 [Segetibacter sp.]|nr:hypothetical protein [Segetibacter sp.]
MVWILFGIVTLLILSIIWFILQYRKDVRKDQEIFDEYLKNQKGPECAKRGRGIMYSKKGNSLFS